LLAWWFWLVAHLFFLIGFRNRIIVLVNWGWSYWTYQRHARIIVGRPDPGLSAGATAEAARARAGPDAAG
jgi:NADH dehydrogenase